MSTGNEIAPIEPSKFLALDRPTSEVSEIIRDNLSGQEVNAFDLPRITVPSGGGVTWEIESPLTGTQSFPELSGIIVHHKLTRAFWEDTDATGTPPDCSSHDNIVGVGKPGGDCRTCPLAQFGSDPKSGRGQACKQQSLWFLLREDSFLPLALGLPPTSLKAAKQYMLALAGEGIRASEVVTTLTLVKETNPDNQKYSRAVPRLGARLNDEAAERARQYGDELRPVFDRIAADAVVAAAAPVEA